MIDIGANLLDPVFRGEYRGKQQHESDLDLVLARAWEAGVERIIVTAGTLAEAREALAFARSDDRLFCTVGVHPTRCLAFEAEGADPATYLSELVTLAKEGKAAGSCVAVGEFGLDYDRLEFCPREVQRTYFEEQFAIAEQTGLPLFLHNRNTGGDFVEMITANRHRFGAGVVHSFDGSEAEASALVAAGLYIGLNGCSLKTEANLAVVRSIPAESIMIETDAPWCDVRRTHAGFEHVETTWETRKEKKFERGLCVKNRNEPCHLQQVLEVIAGVKGIDVDAFAATVYANTMAVFFPAGGGAGEGERTGEGAEVGAEVGGGGDSKAADA